MFSALIEELEALREFWQVLNSHESRKGSVRSAIRLYRHRGRKVQPFGRALRARGVALDILHALLTGANGREMMVRYGTASLA